MAASGAESAIMKARGVSAAARLLLGGRAAQHGALVLTYHDVGVDPDNHTDYYLHPDRMRQHLRWAIEWGLRFVELHEIVDALIAGRSVDGLAAVCFDDSLVGVHHHAMPVLLDLGVPATLFTVTSALGQDPPWWPGAVRVMSKHELDEWSAAGLNVASHTRTHASLPDMSEAYLHDEIRGSRHELEDLVQRTVRLFAYPYGHHDRRSREVAASAGYTCGFTFLNGRVLPGDDMFLLPRLNMWAGQGRARLAFHIGRPAASWPDHQLDRVRGRTPPNLHTYGEAPLQPYPG